MKPQLLPRGLFHSTSVPKKSQKCVSFMKPLYPPLQTFGRTGRRLLYTPPLQARGRHRRAAAPGARWTRPAAILGAEEVLPSDSCVPRCGVLPALAFAAARAPRAVLCAPHTARRVDGAARPVCGPRSRREASLSSAEGRRKLSAPARTYPQTACRARQRPSISTQSEEERAGARKHASAAPLLPQHRGGIGTNPQSSSRESSTTLCAETDGFSTLHSNVDGRRKRAEAQGRREL